MENLNETTWWNISGNSWKDLYSLKRLGTKLRKPLCETSCDFFGDVSRPTPMTVYWSQYAQSQTEKWVKGMLTGPVTILQWSFVRDDQPRSETCKQIALAIRDEVVDPEKQGSELFRLMNLPSEKDYH